MSGVPADAGVRSALDDLQDGLVRAGWVLDPTQRASARLGGWLVLTGLGHVRHGWPPPREWRCSAPPRCGPPTRPSRRRRASRSERRAVPTVTPAVATRAVGMTGAGAGDEQVRRRHRLAAGVAHLAHCAEALTAPLVSEHIVFVRANGTEVGHLLPVPRSWGAIEAIVDNVRGTQDGLPVPLALKPIAALFDRPDDELSETDFLTEILDRTGAGRTGGGAGSWRCDPARLRSGPGQGSPGCPATQAGRRGGRDVAHARRHYGPQWTAAVGAFAADRPTRGKLRHGWDFARWTTTRAQLRPDAAVELTTREAAWRYDANTAPRRRRAPAARPTPAALVLQLAGHVSTIRTRRGPYR